MSKKAAEVAARYGRKTDIVEAWREIIEERKRNGEPVRELAEGLYNIPAYADPMCMAITDSEQLQVMQWGYVSHKTTSPADEQKIEKKDLYKNARAEGIFTTWPYRFSIAHKRCIIPSTGYFEWHHNPDKSTQPYFIFDSRREIFPMGAVYDEWVNRATNERLLSYSIITTGAIPKLAEIHNGGKFPARMPLILADADLDAWLDPELPEKRIAELMKAYGEQSMDAYQISKDFRKMNPRDPAVISRI